MRTRRPSWSWDPDWTEALLKVLGTIALLAFGLFLLGLSYADREEQRNARPEAPPAAQTHDVSTGSVLRAMRRTDARLRQLWADTVPAWLAGENP